MKVFIRGRFRARTHSDSISSKRDPWLPLKSVLVGKTHVLKPKSMQITILGRSFLLNAIILISESTLFGVAYR